MDCVRIGGLAGHDATPFILAISSGLFEQEGLSVEWVDLHNRGPRELENDGLDLCICSLEGALFHILQPDSNLVLAGTYIASKRTKGIYATRPDDEAFSNHNTVFPITGKGASGHILVSMKANELGLECKPKFQKCGSAGAVLAAMENAKPDEPMVVVWDKYAAQPYVSEGKWHAIGEVMTPWSAMVFIAHRRAVETKRWKVLEKFLEVSRKAIIEMCSNPSEAIEHICQNFGMSKSDAKHWMLSSLFSCQSVTSTEDIHACTEQLQQVTDWSMQEATLQGGISAEGCREVQTSAELAALAHFGTWHDSALKLFSMSPSSTHSNAPMAKSQKPGMTVDLMSTTVGDEDLMSIETHTIVPQSVPNNDTADPSSTWNPPAAKRHKPGPVLGLHDWALGDTEAPVQPEGGDFVSNSVRTVHCKSKGARSSAAVIDHHFGTEAENSGDGDFCSNSRHSIYSKRHQRKTQITDHHFGAGDADKSLDGDFCSTPGHSVYSNVQLARTQMEVTDHQVASKNAENSVDSTNAGRCLASAKRPILSHGDFCSNAGRSLYQKGSMATTSGDITDQHFGPGEAQGSSAGDFCSNADKSGYTKSDGPKNQMEVTDHHFGPEEHFHPRWAADLLGGLLCMDSDSTMNFLFGPGGEFG